MEKEKIYSVESLLAKLPKTFLQNYTLQFQGTGLQQASLENPRVLLFGERGKLVITFNGDESQHQFEHVEVLRYSDVKEKFELFDVDFKNQTLTKNPPICLACHATMSGRIRPFFSPYAQWRGFYGADDDLIGLENRKELRAFNKKRTHHPRYRYLEPKVKSSLRLQKFAPYDGNRDRNYEMRPNLRLMNALYWLNSRSITFEMQRHPLYEKLLPLLGALYFPKETIGNEKENSEYKLSVNMIKAAGCNEKLIANFINYFHELHDLLLTPADNDYRRNYIKIQDLFSLLGIPDVAVTMSMHGTNHYLFDLGLKVNESRFLINGKIVNDFYQSSLKVFPIATNPFLIRNLPLVEVAKSNIKNEFDRKFVSYLNDVAVLSNPYLKDASKNDRCAFYGFIDEMLQKSFYK